MHDPIHDVAAFVSQTRLSDIPAPAVSAAKTFILDTLGVGIGGSQGPMAAELVASMQAMGGGSEARVWATGEALPAHAAALCNAYRTHCQEYDCVHEAAVAHCMTVVLPVALAGAERMGAVSGARLLEAVIAGVETACALGVAPTSGLRFFRPGTVGAFGGTAALGRLHGLDSARQVEAFSLAYGQLCGTMQAHTEGSGLLALQMGFNARNAVMAVDLATSGFTGPHGILSGDFGYFRLFEAGGDPEAAIAELGRTWRVTEIAHKPFPSGRATHGILDGCLSLQREHGFTAAEIAGIHLGVPPLVHHLVGRPAKTSMALNYARLCARYVLSAALHRGSVAIEDFTEQAYATASLQSLAARTVMEVEDRGDPNALTPISIEVTLTNGRVLRSTVEQVWGGPGNPMSRAAQLEKLSQNCATLPRQLPADQIDNLVATVDRLEEVPDVTVLADLLVP